MSWEVDGEKLRDLLRLHQVVVANDLEVTAYGIASLEKNDLVALNVGEPDPEGNEALIAAGTGLGEVELSWQIMDPVIQGFSGGDAPPLEIYERGSWGPKGADELLAREGRSWLHGRGKS